MVRSMGGAAALAAMMAVRGVGAAAPVPELLLGGEESDRGVSITTTADGGFVVVGVTKSLGSGGEDVFLVRLSADGTVLWQRAIGGPGDDDGWAVQEREDGGFVIAGFTNGEGARGLDCFLVNTDTDGIVNWTTTIGGAKDDRCWALAPTEDGGWVLAGETDSSGAGERDCYIVKTDDGGREVWSSVVGGEADDRCFAVAGSADGGYVVAGQTYSYGAGDRDAWILKVDRRGTLEWSKTHGGEASDVAHSVITDGRKSYLVTGYTTSLAESPDDPMIIKISGDGTIEWSRVLALDGHNRAITGAPAAGGGMCLSGLSITGAPPTGSALIIRVDDNGRMMWSNRVAVTQRGDSMGYGVTGTADGGCAITGHTTKGSAGDIDLLFARVGAEGR